MVRWHYEETEVGTRLAAAQGTRRNNWGGRRMAEAMTRQQPKAEKKGDGGGMLGWRREDKEREDQRRMAWNTR